jgi:hypothetical protein
MGAQAFGGKHCLPLASTSCQRTGASGAPT